MGMESPRDLYDSPLAGALWETAVFTELRRLLAGRGGWQVWYWRDRTKEADFLLHKAGRFLLADAKWSEHPSDPGKLRRIRSELDPYPPCALICRTDNPYPLGNDIQAIPLGSLSKLLGLT